LSALRFESEANLLKLSLQQQQIADYQTRVEELENQLTIEMNNEQSVVERELNKWEEVNVKYQDALREWDVLREEYQSKESEYLDEIDALRTQLNEFTSMAQEESAANDGTISKLRLEIQELCLQIEKLEKDNGNLSAALSETDQRYQEFEHLLQSQESQMEALRSQLSESTLMGQEEGTVKDKVIDDLRLEVEKLQKDNASLSAALSETGQRTSEFEQSIESQETEMSSLLQQISEMKLRKGQLQDSFAEIMTKYESEAAEKLEIAQKYETEIDELKQRLCVAEETISQLEESQRAVPQEKPSQAEGPSGDFSEGTPSDIEERFRKEIGESESGQVSESSLRRESEESELQQMSALLEKQNKDLTDELSDLREHVRTVEAERSECVSLQQRISALEREKDSLEADREFVERNSEERLLALERDFEGKVATMRAELEQSISHFNEEKSRIESESEETRCQREEAHIEEKRALEEQLQSWKLQCDANEQLVSELKAEVSSIKEQMKTQQDSKKGVEQKLKKFAIELKNKHSALTESQGEVKKLQASVAQREEELRQLKDESDLHHRQQEERIAEVEAASLKKCRAEKSKLEAALAEASRSREEVSILQAQLDENRKLLEEYEAQSSAGKDWKQAAELKLKKYAMELKTRGATVKDLTEGLSQSKELVATLQHQLQEANLLKSQQAENLHRLSGECEAAQLRSCHLESEIASLQYQLEGTRREVSHERDEFQQQFDDLVEWKKVNEVKLKKYAVELRSRQEIIRDLKSQQEEWVRQRDSLENEVARLDKANQDLISSDELETKFQRLKDENLRLQKLVGDSQKNLPSPVLPPSPPPALASESVLAELTEEREGRKVAEAKVKKYALELRGKLATVKELKGEMERANSEVERLKGEAATKDQELRQAQQQAEEISKDRDASREELDRLTAALRKLEEQHKQEIAESEAQFQRQLIELRQIDESQRSSEREHLLLQLSGFEERNSQLQSEIGNSLTSLSLSL
jgi:chromosome segregation ATPase